MTRLIGPANPFIRTEVDVAFDADLNDPAESWPWTNMGDYTAESRTRPRVLNQTIEIANGRRDESNLADPSTVDVLLGNGDLALTPGNPSSIYHPGLRRGTPLRVQVQAGLPHLLLTGLDGSRARTPDAAALDITGPLALAVELLSPVPIPPLGFSYMLAGKYVQTGNQRSWLLFLSQTGRVFFRFTADGSTNQDKTTTLGLARPEAGPYTIGLEFDPDNGASENTADWYARRGTVDDLRADLAGSFIEQDVDAGATSIFSSSAPLDLGDIEGITASPAFLPYPGRLNRFQLRSGDLTSGTVVADLDCTGLAAAATGTTDPAGRVWAFNEATISDRRPRFCGRVDKVTADWSQVDEDNPLSPTVAHVQVSASGVLERLAQGDAIGGALSRLMAAPFNQGRVISAWTFEDGPDATQAANFISGAPPMNVRGAFTFGGDTSFDAVVRQMTVAAGENALMTASIPQIPQVTGVNWSVTKFFRIDEPETSPAATGLMVVGGNGRVARWLVTINDTQVSIAGLDIDGGGVVLAAIPFDSRFFDTEAMLVLDVTDDGANVDWAVSLIPIPLGFLFSTSGTYAGDTGVPTYFKNSTTGPPSGISLGPVVVSTDTPIGWLAPADTAFVGEPATSRVFRLCQEQNIPIVIDGPFGVDWDAVIAAGGQAMGPQLPGKLLDLIDECAVVDHGVLGEQRGSLGLFLRSGRSMLGQPTRLTLARADRQVIDPFAEVDDDLRSANDVTVSRVDGSSYRIEDPSIATGVEERYQQTVEVNVDSDLRLPGQAGWRYHLGTWPEPRFPQVWSDVAKDAALVEGMLGFGIGDRLEVSDPPPGCPPVDQLADGIVEELERFQWRVGINGHPARAWGTAVVDDDDFGRVDTAGSETSGSFTSGTSTSMSVATTLGTVWTTDSADFPFDIEVAGVRLTVTNVTGASSPQTFTVTQTPVNGVAKTIPTGSAVQLWQGAVVAP
jgi:hypothetical protein